MMNENMSQNALAIKTLDFEGHPVTAVMWDGRPAWVASQVGAALGFADGARFVDKIRGEWAEEFIDGTDIDTLTNGKVREFLAASSELPPESGETSQVVSKFAGRLVILYEPGLHLALLKTRKPAGKRLRRLLADEVLPQLRATGTVTLAGAQPANDVLAAQMDLVRQSLVQQAHLVEMMRTILARLDSGPVGGVIGEAIAREAIEIPVESAIETHAHSKKTQRSLRRSIYNRLQSAAQFTGPNSEWSNLPVSLLARTQRALSGMLKEVPDRAAKLDARNGVLGPLFDGTKKRTRKSARGART